MPLLRVKVKPNARRSALELAPDGSFVAHVRAAPVDGKANAELIALVAAHFGFPRSTVRIKSGAAGRTKWVAVPDG